MTPLVLVLRTSTSRSTLLLLLGPRPPLPAPRPAANNVVVLVWLDYLLDERDAFRIGVADFAHE